MIRTKIFGGKSDLFSRIKKSTNLKTEEAKGEKKLDRPREGKEKLNKLASQVLRDKTRTILKPGQLAQLKETGSWRVTSLDIPEVTKTDLTKK